MRTQWYKVQIINYRTPGGSVGYGEGIYHDTAVDDAMQRAQLIDPRAYYDPDSDTVRVAGGVIR